MEVGNYLVLKPNRFMEHYKEAHFLVFAQYDKSRFLLKCMKLIGRFETIEEDTYYQINTKHKSTPLEMVLNGPLLRRYKCYEYYCAKEL